MIRLYVLPLPSWGLQLSPFCVKLEFWLRLAGLPFETITKFQPGRAPKGKYPFIVEEDGAAPLGDSGFIIEHLTRKHHVTIDDGLDAHARAQSVALRALIEDQLYFALLYTRWIEADGWAVLKPGAFGTLPLIMRDLIPMLARRGVRKSLWGQGTGRHTAEEVHAIGRAGVDALAELLGSKQFLLADRPHSIDASAFGTLANLAYAPFVGPLNDALVGHANLRAYTDRLMALYRPA
jgi:glutathione S-transferase